MDDASTPVNKLREVLERAKLAHAETDPAELDQDAADGAIDLGTPADPAHLAELLGDDVRRLAIAQHWARASLSVAPGDVWSPIVMACAIAALCSRDLEELRRTLAETVGRVGTDPRTANVWRAAVVELDEAIGGTGLAIEEPNEWAWPLLRSQLAQFLDASQAEAQRRRTASMVPNDSDSDDGT